jgi:hypothetical protein
VSDEFTCAACGGTFGKAWSDEEAQAEADDIFGDILVTDGSAIVCDDCFHEMERQVPMRAWAEERRRG